MSEGKTKKNGRTPFMHNGQVVYEFEQSLEEMLIYITVPEGVKSKILDIKITTDRLHVGIKGNPPFLGEAFPFPVNAGESLWTLDGQELEIQLQKGEIGKTWPCALRGHATLDPGEQQKVTQKLLLERFSRENPGMDFSQAKFNGEAPDARDFMGGINTTQFR